MTHTQSASQIPTPSQRLQCSQPPSPQPPSPMPDGNQVTCRPKAQATHGPRTSCARPSTFPTQPLASNLPPSNNLARCPMPQCPMEVKPPADPNHKLRMGHAQAAPPPLTFPTQPLASNFLPQRAKPQTGPSLNANDTSRCPTPMEVKSPPDPNHKSRISHAQVAHAPSAFPSGLATHNLWFAVSDVPPKTRTWPKGKTQPQTLRLQCPMR